jgi:hypothetical protein
VLALGFGFPMLVQTMRGVACLACLALPSSDGTGAVHLLLAHSRHWPLPKPWLVLNLALSGC